MDQWRTGRVIENRHWNERLCSVKVAVEMPVFKAGQFTRVALPDGNDMLARAYSLVNAPGEPHAEFYFNKVPEGPLSPRLHQLKKGDPLYISATAAVRLKRGSTQINLAPLSLACITYLKDMG